MHDAFDVGGVERIGNLDREREKGLKLHGAPGDPVLERRALEEFHDDEGPAAFLADLVDGADIGMVEGGGSLRLTLKTGQSLRVFGDVIGQELEGDKAVEVQVLGLVNHAHATAAELFDDAVVRNGLVDHWGAMLWRRARGSQ